MGAEALGRRLLGEVEEARLDEVRLGYIPPRQLDDEFLSFFFTAHNIRQ